MPLIIDKIRSRRKEFKAEQERLLSGIAAENQHKPQTSEKGQRRETDGNDGNELARPLPPGWYYSFEYFPPKTEPGLDNLITRIDRMSRRLDPLFLSITWGANGPNYAQYHSTLSRTFAVASHAQRYACVDVLLHLSCTNLSCEQIASVLDMARNAGVCNILALRGDPPLGKRAWKIGDVSGGECERAIDLVKLIRKLHGGYFGIGVAGHPEGHPSSPKTLEGKAAEMRHLKEKIDAGADFIITQFFYDVDIFLSYVRDCRKAGIFCPIIPGIMPIQSYSSLVKMTQFCGIRVPPKVMQRLEGVKDDDEAVKKIGCEIAAEMCALILRASFSGPQQDPLPANVDGNITNHSANNESCNDASGIGQLLDIDGFHFYTLNLERSTTRILASLGAVDVMTRPRGDSSNETRSVDVKNANGENFSGTTTIPEISKITEFDILAVSGTNSTNAIGNSSTAIPTSASIAATTNRRERKESISEELSATRRKLPWKPSTMANRSKEDVRPINWSNRPKSYVMRTDDWDEFPNGRWGDSTSPAFGELSNISHFYSFTLGSDDDRRTLLGHNPVTEYDVFRVFARYVAGTIPHIPWCETPLQPESYLIQDQLIKLNQYGFLTVNSQPPVNGTSSSHPAFGWGGSGGWVYQKAYFECFVSPDKANRLTCMVTNNPTMNLYAVNYSGQDLRVGVQEGGVTALTWGVFPNREIVQPTIFDPDTFLVWAEEAFSLWGSMWLNLYEFGSESYELIERIRDTYYLVAIIDNDFVSGGVACGSGGGKENGNFPLLTALLEVGKDAASSSL